MSGTDRAGRKGIEMTQLNEQMRHILENESMSDRRTGNKDAEMLDVERGITTLKSAAYANHCTVDEYYTRVIESGHRAPFYMTDDNALQIDFSLPYAYVYEAYQQTEAEVKYAEAERDEAAYFMELVGLQFSAGCRTKRGVVRFRIVGEVGEDKIVTFRPQKTGVTEIDERQTAFWNELVIVMRIPGM